VARFAWNWGLTKYHQIKASGEKVNWNAIIKEFRSLIDTQFPFVRNVTKSSPEYAFVDLRQTISSFYKKKKQGDKRVKFPKWRSKKKTGNSFGIANDQFEINGNSVRIPRLGWVTMTQSLRFEGKILSGRVNEKNGHWYISITVEVQEDEVAVYAGAQGSIGLDAGVKSFLTLSNAEVCENQAYFKRAQSKLRRLQRGLSRKKCHSSNWLKWKQRVSRFQEKVSNQRQDYIHKVTTAIASRFETVCIESLNVAGMVRSNLGKSIHDVGIAEAYRQLKYKAKCVVEVDRFFPSSRLCHSCGYKNKELWLQDREWLCPGCDVLHDRDWNAARNIEREGLRLLGLV